MVAKGKLSGGPTTPNSAFLPVGTALSAVVLRDTNKPAIDGIAECPQAEGRNWLNNRIQNPWSPGAQISRRRRPEPSNFVQAPSQPNEGVLEASSRGENPTDDVHRDGRTAGRWPTQTKLELV